MEKFKLRYQTSQAWVDAVLADFDSFLVDHAAAEKKASGMAISMLSHYRDRKELVQEMADLAIEELVHYREVIKILHQRGGMIEKDTKDDYVNAFRKAIRQNNASIPYDAYFLDRLLIGGIIEARGAERFGLIADALEPSKMKDFYRSIAKSEERHLVLMVELAELYFDNSLVAERLDELLDFEAEICAQLPIKSALH